MSHPVPMSAPLTARAPAGAQPQVVAFWSGQPGRAVDIRTRYGDRGSWWNASSRREVADTTPGGPCSLVWSYLSVDGPDEQELEASRVARQLCDKMPPSLAFGVRSARMIRVSRGPKLESSWELWLRPRESLAQRWGSPGDSSLCFAARVLGNQVQWDPVVSAVSAGADGASEGFNWSYDFRSETEVEASYTRPWYMAAGLARDPWAF
ncbi:hypothetical protein GPECTOR_19g214 [Gonium pectorale]|uniref:Uncharacterized protein n=1 Tax=Gonium pectorale TaxID=33097 RepID=A0A150GIX8_GONPE|nr:hypothetical protein GPECTOR_19g214 [Gonium pectorale]|eukprot:KXZ49763.1 hypothetical protein GPECTOR_19g214 [Gonium pectorale]